MSNPRYSNGVQNNLWQNLCFLKKGHYHSLVDSKPCTAQVGGILSQSPILVEFSGRCCWVLEMGLGQVWQEFICDGTVH